MKQTFQKMVIRLLLATVCLSFLTFSGCAMFKKEEPQKFETMQDFLSAPKPESPNQHY